MVSTYIIAYSSGRISRSEAILTNELEASVEQSLNEPFHELQTVDGALVLLFLAHVLSACIGFEEYVRENALSATNRRVVRK